MSKKTYRTLNNLIKSIREISSENGFDEEEYNSLENFLLSISFSFLYGIFNTDKKNYDRNPLHSSEDLRRYVPEAFLNEFPFTGNIILPDHFIRTFGKMFTEEGCELPAIIHEFFLENFSEGKVCEKGRKKTGVFYTPHPIVEYIVDKTLGRRINYALEVLKSSLITCNMDSFIDTWEEMKNIRVVDPSSGWGIFLLHSYRRLSEFHMTAGKLARLMIEKEACMPFDAFDMLSEEYVDFAAKIEKLKEICITGKNPGAMITGNNIFGFDIDRKAAKIARHILLSEAGAAPDGFSGTNNTIIYTDFIKGFADIKKHRFDFVLGNPPYFSIGGGGKGKSKTEYHAILNLDPFFSRFFRSQSDIFYYFVAGGIELLKPGGQLSFITPSYWLENEFADLLRESMVRQCKIEEIINFTPVRVFETRRGKPVNVDTTIFRIRKTDADPMINREKIFKAYIPVTEKGSANSLSYKEFLDNIEGACENQGNGSKIHKIPISQEELSGGKWILSPHREILSLMKKDMEKILSLGDISSNTLDKFPGEFINFKGKKIAGVCSIGQGQETGLSEVFLLKDELALDLGLEREILKPVVKNSHVLRYGLSESGSVMIMLTDEDDISLYPRTKDYLEKHRSALESRQRVRTKSRKWFAISIPQNYRIFDEAVKILVPYRATENRFAIDRGRHFNDGGDVRGIAINDRMKDIFSYEYLAALLNSRLLTFWFQQCGKRKGNIYEYFTNPMSRIPIRVPDISEKQALELLVSQVQDLYATMRTGNNLNKFNYTPDKIHGKISEVEGEIDRIVYQIYGISSLHIKVVEDSITSGTKI